jgi:hypothetical protein
MAIFGGKLSQDRPTDLASGPEGRLRRHRGPELAGRDWDFILPGPGRA